MIGFTGTAFGLYHDATQPVADEAVRFFFGDSEWAQIGKESIASVDDWVLHTGQGTSSANVTAHARCISRTQQ